MNIYQELLKNLIKILFKLNQCIIKKMIKMSEKNGFCKNSVIQLQQKENIKHFAI